MGKAVENSKGCQSAMAVLKCILGVTVLTLAIFSVDAASRGAEPPGTDVNGKATGEPFAPREGPWLSLRLQAPGDLALGAMNESAAEFAEEDKLAKQLANPISSLISVPFQANEDFGYGPTGKGYKFTLNIQPVVPISLNKDWNLIVRTIVPIVSQHDLFYFANLPKNSPLQPQNRSQDGLSDTTQSFFFSPQQPGPFGIQWTCRTRATPIRSARPN
jgi:hypothetical protein